jgi:hypothetical protein
VLRLASENASLQEFITLVQRNYTITVVGVSQGAKPIYLPLMFAGKDIDETRQYLDKALLTFLEYQEWDEYVELDITV